MSPSLCPYRYVCMSILYCTVVYCCALASLFGFPSPYTVLPGRRSTGVPIRDSISRIRDTELRFWLSSSLTHLPTIHLPKIVILRRTFFASKPNLAKSPLVGGSFCFTKSKSSFSKSGGQSANYIAAEISALLDENWPIYVPLIIHVRTEQYSTLQYGTVQYTCRALHDEMSTKFFT